MIILEAALLYAKVGIPVFPVSGINSQGKCTCNNPGCSHPGKHPLLKGGHKIATTNIQQIEQWWAQHPNANIGIPTGQASGLYIVDIDKKHDGAANYQAFLNGLPDIIPDATLISATGGGGFHLIYQAPINKMLVRCGTNIGGLPGVDFRGNGGYIVAPPSLHVSGTIYQWCQGVELDEQFDLTKLVPLPLSIATLLSQP